MVVVVVVEVVEQVFFESAIQPYHSTDRAPVSHFASLVVGLLFLCFPCVRGPACSVYHVCFHVFVGPLVALFTTRLHAQHRQSTLEQVQLLAASTRTQPAAGTWVFRPQPLPSSRSFLFHFPSCNI